MDKNPHTGHRQRVRERAVAEGLSGFAPHEVIELLLMQVIPMRDLNPLSHALIDRFGSVDGVLSASADELKAVPGMGERSAAWLNAYGRLVNEYISEPPSEGTVIKGPDDMFRFVEELSGDAGDRFAVCMDRGERVTGFARVTDELSETVKAALEMRAASVFTVVLVPDDISEIDRRETEFAFKLNTVLPALDIEYRDHAVSAGSRCFSFRQAGILDGGTK